MFFVAFDPPILKHRLTKGAKRDGKFEAEDCIFLSFFTGDGHTRQCVGLTFIHLFVSAAIHPPTIRRQGNATA
jgi:hypothetical protein